jgi:hypothetical protein
MLLAAGEPSHINNAPNIDAHSLEGGTMGNRRDYELTIVLEADKPAIEEVINARRQKQAILAVQPLFVGRVSPWLAVTSDQMDGIFDACDAASGFDLAHAIFEKALSIPGKDYRQSFSFWNGEISDQLLLQPSLPKIEIICRNRLLRHARLKQWARFPGRSGL